MKNIWKIIFLVFANFSLFTLHSQDECHLNERMDERRAQSEEIDSIIKAGSIQLENFTQDFIQNQYAQTLAQRTGPYIIPVVFHVLHTNGLENISDEQIMDCLDHLNQDFNKMNSNWNTVQSAFLGIVADCEVEFKLAKRDNDGNCHKGITRTYSQTTHDGSDYWLQSDAVQQSQGFWPSTKYMNVFVVADAGGAGGFTFYPNNWNQQSMENGIWMRHDHVGGIGTSFPNRAPVISHEAGHWLNLMHLWGNSNSPLLSGNCMDDDGVNDTPNTIGWTACNLSGVTCGSSDNVENYMEYAGCRKMFTEGQKARMHAALNSSVGGRNNLWSNANLTATGVNLPDELCVAEFKSDKVVVCLGESVSFEDDSYHSPNNWNWTFNGGTPATSNNQNPTITFNTPGTFSVSLTASDGVNSETETKVNYITVLPSSFHIPFVEDFENLSQLVLPEWEVINFNNNNTFELHVGASLSPGNQCGKINNFGQQENLMNELISKPINMINSGAKTLIFKYAFKKTSSADNDVLQIFFSNDCGETWMLRKNINFINADIQTSAYTSPIESDWRTEVLNDVFFTGFESENFRVKFKFTSGGGNNFFIDDINVTGSNVSVQELNNNPFDFNLYPNPTDNNIQIELLSNIQNSDYQINITDYTGREVYQTSINNGDIKRTNKEQGLKRTHSINVGSWSSGVYLVEVVKASERKFKKLVVK